MGCASLSKPKLSNSSFKTNTSRINFGKGRNNALAYSHQTFFKRNLNKIFKKYKSRMLVIYEALLESEIEA